jgi:hypothetical protein
MNLRFADNSLRIRVTADEFAQLHAGQSLALQVSLPRGHEFRLKLNQGSGDWQFDSDPTGLWLSIPRAELAALAQRLPSKEGIAHGFATQHAELQISFEVDAGYC